MEVKNGYYFDMYKRFVRITIAESHDEVQIVDMKHSAYWYDDKSVWDRYCQNGIVKGPFPDVRLMKVLYGV